MKATIKLDAGGGWRYRVKAANGELIDASESYTRRASALKALRRNHPVGKIELYDREGFLFKVLEG